MKHNNHNFFLISNYKKNLIDEFKIIFNNKKCNYKLENGFNWKFNNNILIIKLNKSKNPAWHKNQIIKSEINDNKTNYRIFIFKYSFEEYLFEINGNIKILDKYFDEKKIDFNKEKINLNYWNKNNNISDIEHEKLKTIIDNYIKINEINKINNELNIQNSTEFNKINLEKVNNDLTVNKMIEKYDNLINIKKLKNNNLPDYNLKNCKTPKSNKIGDEGKYNETVVENNKEKYVLLDKKLIKGIEIADIYDKNNNLLFHNKKNGDLRVLAMQILNGCLIIKDDGLCEEFCINNNLNHEKIKNSEYVFGIIKINKNSIAYKDKFAIAYCCYLLDELNISYHYDEINVI